MELQNKNELLEERSHALAMEHSFRQHLETQAAKPPDGTLVVGSSLVRDLDEKLYENTKVVSISGGIPKDATNVLNSQGDTRFSKVILVVGGNQVNENMDNMEEVTSDMREAVLVAKTMAPSVAMCELPPRLNSENGSKGIKKLNEKVEELAVAVDAEFIKTKDIFTLANGEPNDGCFLQDGGHLN